MKIILWTSPFPVPIEHTKALSKGLKRHGIDHEVRKDSDPYEPSDIAMVCGWMKRILQKQNSRVPIIRGQQERGLRLLVQERGYLCKDRDKWSSLGWDGLNGRAEHNNRGMDDSRWKKLQERQKWSLAPWRETEKDDPILICGQVPWDASVEHISYEQWFRATVDTILSSTTRPIEIRSHPKIEQSKLQGWVNGLPVNGRVRWRSAAYAGSYGISNFSERMEEPCFATVAFNSTAGNESVLRGVPHFCSDIGSMCYDVSGHDLTQIDNPPRPDRQPWLNDLCWTQWHIDELANGDAIPHVFQGVL